MSLETISKLPNHNMDEIMDKLRTANQSYHDERTTAYLLSRDKEPRGDLSMVQLTLRDLYQEELGTLSLTRHAEGMLLTRLRIPGGYYHRCPENLQKDQINYWLSNSHQSLCLRMQVGDTCRAVFGKRFKPDLDDLIVAPKFLEETLARHGGQYGDMQIPYFRKTHELTKIDVIYGELHAEYNGIDALGGVSLVNSEIGCSALHIRPTVYNHRGNLWLDFYAGAGGSTSLRHTQQMKEGAMEEAVGKALQTAQYGTQRLFETMHEEVSGKDFKKLVDSSAVLSERLMDGLVEAYEVKQLTTKYNIAEDILRACSTLPLFKQHVVKVEVGRYLNLFGADEARFDDIFED